MAMIPYFENMNDGLSVVVAHTEKTDYTYIHVVCDFSFNVKLDDSQILEPCIFRSNNPLVCPLGE